MPQPMQETQLNVRSNINGLSVSQFLAQVNQSIDIIEGNSLIGIQKQSQTDKQKQKLIKQIKLLSQQNIQLTEKNQFLASEYESTKAVWREQNQKCEQLQQQTKKLNQFIKQLQNEKSQFNKIIRQCQQQYQEKLQVQETEKEIFKTIEEQRSNQVEKLKVQIKQLQNKHQNQKMSQVENLNEEMIKLRSMAQEKKQIISQLRQRFYQIDIEYKHKIEQIQKKHEEENKLQYEQQIQLNNLRKEFNQILLQLQNQRQLSQKIKVQVETIQSKSQNQIQSQQQTIQKLQSQIQTIKNDKEKQVQELLTARDYANHNIKVMEQKIKEKDDELCKVAKELQETRRQLKEENLMNMELHDKLTANNDLVDRLEQQITLLKDKVQGVNNSMSRSGDLTIQLQIMEESLVQQQQAYDKLRQQSTQLQQELQSLQTQLAKINTSLTQQLQKNKKLSIELLNQKQQLNIALSQRRQCTNLMRDLQIQLSTQKCTHLENQRLISILKSQNQSLTQDLTTQQSKNQNLSIIINQKQQQTNKLNNQLINIKKIQLQQQVSRNKNKQQTLKVQKLVTLTEQLNQKLKKYEEPKNIQQRFELIQSWFSCPNFSRRDKILFMNWTEQFFAEFAFVYNSYGEQSVDMLNCVQIQKIK